MATSTMNGSSAIDSNGSISKATSASQPQIKSTTGLKMADGAKKLNDEVSQRRAPEPRAWTSGSLNPITQRANTPSQSNGTAMSGKAYSQKSYTPPDVGNLVQIANDRQNYALGAIFGQRAVIFTTSGEKYGGVFAGLSGEGGDTTMLFKMVRGILEGTNGRHDPFGEYIGSGLDHAMIFNGADVSGITVDKVNMQFTPSQNGVSQGFRTDTDISGNLAIRERNLQRWEGPSEGASTDMSLESGGGWDQFKANEDKFGLKSDYNENIYTTKIDKSNPLYPLREREAERVARLIEGDSSTNAHMKDERGIQQDGDGLDEEARFSGVQRNGPEYPPLKSNQPNKYTTPARRALPPNTSNAGDSIDPAIISSQIARPSSKVQEPEVQKAATMAPAKTAKLGVTATENVESELLDSFRQFANTEKMRVQDNRRSRASADKATKYNELMKFAKNFKLTTPVPKDLIPILAKSESKQREIVEKAERSAKSNHLAMADPATPTSEIPQRQRPRQQEQPSHVQTGQAGKDRHTNHSSRTTQNGLSERLAQSHRSHKAGNTGSIPNVVPIPPIRTSGQGSGLSSPMKSAGIRSPTTSVSAKLNVQAMEFKPNPAASAFKPANIAPATLRPASGIIAPVIPRSFFGDQTITAIEERTVTLDDFNPLKLLKSEALVDPKAKDSSSNGGIKRAYTTPPTWTQPKDSEKYTSYRDSANAARPKHAAPQQSPPINQAAHQHQLPFHLQNGSQNVPQVHTPHQIPHQVPQQPHHYSHGQQHQYDDHHMRPSASSSSVFPAPSPRMQNTNMAAYPSPMSHHAQLAYGQPMPHYVMGPNGPHHASPRHFSGGPQMMGPGQGPHLATPMMMQQPSNGAYMMPQPMGMPYNPQMPMYPGAPTQHYGMGSQPPSNYPSPGRGAPMMMHQGSHQGQHQPMYMSAGQYGQPVYAQQAPAHMTPMRGNYGSPQPHFAQSPYQQHHYPHQAHRTPSNGYAQLNHTHQPHVAPQAPPPATSMDMGDEAK